MTELTVGYLRELLKDVPDDTLVVGDECEHIYRQMWSSGVGYTTVLDDGDGQFTQDIFIPREGEGIGEQTEYGTRIRAFVIA